jgi:SAM-dependent methyltransferase
MPVTRDEVEWAYRMLLGREVENEAAVQGHLGHADRTALRQAFIQSPEFRNGSEHDAGPAVGDYQDVKTIPVDIGCSDDQLKDMIQHIAGEWRKYGEDVPHWSVLTGDEFRPENISENIEKFYETGRNHASVMLNPLSRSGIGIDHFQRVMDFGCRLGRLTLALAPIAAEIVGVDISPPHLALARERAGPGSNAKFISINNVEDLGKIGSFDLIISFIVLQHNPPPVMAEILRKLLSCLAPGGCIVIQIPTYIVNYEFAAQAYLANANPGITANVLPQHEIFRIFFEADCVPLEVRQDNFLGSALSHTFAAQKSSG